MLKASLRYLCTLEWGSGQNVLTEQKRHRVNRFAREQIAKYVNGSCVSFDIDYQTPGFFRPDGVHLSDIGLDMYLDSVRETLLQLL